jgi:hypothetical protein
MKKIFCIFMAIALCLCMCACGGPGDTYMGSKLFERIRVFDDCCIYRHVDTNVLYTYYGGGFTVMFNADGTPMVWSGH